MFENHKKESPIVSLLGVGGGISYPGFIRRGVDGYTISRSLRFNSADSAYLSRTPASAGNRRTWTWAGWVKRSAISSGDCLFQSRNGSNTASTHFELYFASDQLAIGYGDANWLVSTAKYRDFSAWYHIVLSVDTTQATGSDRHKLYVNGTQITEFATNSPIAQNTDTAINNNIIHAIGARFNADEPNLNGYLADIHFIDGQALDPTSFGEFDTNGIWQPKRYTGEYGTNGFHLDFADNSTAAALGTDSAGSNDWTVNNIATWTGGALFYSGHLSNETNPGQWRGNNETPNLAFDGSLSTAARVENTDDVILLDFSTLSLTGAFEVYTNYAQTAALNGTSYSISMPANAWTTITSDASTLNTVRFYCSGCRARVVAVRVDGVVLVNNTSPSNDSLVDSPTNGTETDTGVGGEVRGNYCTWSPISWRRASSVQLLDGNLNFGDQGVSNRYGSVFGTIAVQSGKFYWEILLNSGTGPDSNCYIGVVPVEQVETNNSVNVFNANSAALSLRTSPTPVAYRGDNTSTSYGTQVLIGDTIGLALDVDNLTIEFYKNGVSMGTFPYALASGYTWIPFVTDWSNDTPVSEFILNAGQRPFAYTAPSGFKALCTANLPTPSILKGSDYVGIVTYTGNGSTQTISGLEFSPDFVWIKRRNGTGQHVLTDSVRGTDKQLFSSLTNAEQTSTTGITSFYSDGFSLGTNVSPTGSTNGSGSTYAAWCWDAGSSTVTNTDGSITSSVRANASAGFSIVTWTTSGSTGDYISVGHGLNALPGLVITKSRSNVDGWYTAHGFDLTQFGTLNTTNAFTSASVAWGDGITSSVIGMRVGNFTANGYTHVAYCFAPVEGYSAFGSYTGNGSADGPFVYTGFRPRWILTKVSSTTAYDWMIYDTERDTYNTADKFLVPNYAGAEQVEAGGTTITTSDIDILSNGFKFRTTYLDINRSGETYIYAAFAENPFALNARAR